LAQFSPSTSKLREFSPYNPTLLSLFDVSNAFHDRFLVNIEAKIVSNGLNISNAIMKCV